MPPTRSDTAAATACQRISASAGWWKTSPLLGQVLNMRFTAISALPWLLHYVEHARHRVMIDAAVLVADDVVGAGRRGRECHHVVVAGVHLDVDVLGLQREAV